MRSKFILVMTAVVTLAGCTSTKTVHHQKDTGHLNRFSVLPAQVGADVIVSDSSIADRPLEIVKDSQMAERLGWAIATEMESSLNRNGAYARILEGEEFKADIAAVQEAFASLVWRVKSRKASERANFDEELGKAATRLAIKVGVDAVACGLMTAKVKSSESWKQNFVDATIQAAVTGTATVFTRSETELYLAVIKNGGEIVWLKSRNTTTLFKDGTTAGAVRKGVEQTFESFLASNSKP